MYTKGSSALKTEYYTYDETKQRKTASVKAVPSKKAYSR